MAQSVGSLFELHKKTSLALRGVQMCLLTLDGMIYRDWECLSLLLQRTPFQSGIAATLYRALALEEPTAASTGPGPQLPPLAQSTHQLHTGTATFRALPT